MASLSRQYQKFIRTGKELLIFVAQRASCNCCKHRLVNQRTTRLLDVYRLTTHPLVAQDIQQTMHSLHGCEHLLGFVPFAEVSRRIKHCDSKPVSSPSSRRLLSLSTKNLMSVGSPPSAHLRSSLVSAFIVLTKLRSNRRGIDTFVKTAQPDLIRFRYNTTMRLPACRPTH